MQKKYYQRIKGLDYPTSSTIFHAIKLFLKVQRICGSGYMIMRTSCQEKGRKGDYWKTELFFRTPRKEKMNRIISFKN